MGTKVGLKFQELSKTATQNVVGSDGLTICAKIVSYPLTSTRSGLCSWHTKYTETSGQQ